MHDRLNRVVDLFHRRWTIPVLAELERGHGAKLVTLEKTLGVGRSTLKQTLEGLIDLGFVERNTGYGHPMRPEYLLTAEGARLAPCSGRLLATARRLAVEPLAFRKWTMPLTFVLQDQVMRFSELRNALGVVTPRALTLSLKDMQEAQLVQRDVYDDYPPMTCYKLHRRARPMLEALVPLAMAV